MPGTEPSCDETGARPVRDGVLPGQAAASSPDGPARYGGTALEPAWLSLADADAVAATTDPGRSGAFQVGVAAAKGYAFSLGVPPYGVHHPAGHVAAAALEHAARTLLARTAA
ncbi:hypothetical protein [Kitasatospora sp. NPDC090308]|uniref:hypothetical protein n=1 Tax=Kitasatospora sp. NPDC090308 TaxID=3364082 RepID=UPI00380747A2